MVVGMEMRMSTASTASAPATPATPATPASHGQALHGQRLALELVEPGDVERAVRIFHRDGFVAIRDALDPGQLRIAQSGAQRVIAEQTAAIPREQANRGLARYSFGPQMHNPEWAMLCDLATTLPIIDRIWGAQDHACIGGGGDYSLPGAEIQPLHSDLGDFLRDPLGVVDARDLPTPFIVVNVLMVEFTELNGAIRFVPGTQRSRAPIPALADEPEWMRRNLVCAPAGTAIIRDVRCWHGGTANRSQQIRPMTSVGYYAPWFRGRKEATLPDAIWRTLSPRGQQLCEAYLRP
jgi:ectoine hydroxylase-related dioxygenase (phytanoyl-CoA dioxygenase family)